MWGGYDKQERFLKALKKGDLPFIRKALEKHPEWLGQEFVYASDNKRGSPLHAAAHYDYPEIVIYLAQLRPSSVNGTNRFGSTALHHACKNDSSDSAAALLKLGADPWLKNNEGDVPALLCESAAMDGVFRDVLAARRKIEEEQEREQQAREAEKQAQEERKRAERAHQEALKKQEQDNLISAIGAGRLEQVKTALEAHPHWLEEHFDTYVQGKVGTVLHAAAHFNRPEIILYLVREKNLPPDQKNSAGNTPLHHASMNGSADAVRALLELGADPWLKNKKGETPVSEAASENLKPLFGPIIERAEIMKQWSRTASDEVVRARTLPDGSYRLTDIFNFHTRCWTSITKDVKSGHIAQSVFFFDDVPDRQVLEDALECLQALGGRADPDVIHSRSIDKPKPAGMKG